MTETTSVTGEPPSPSSSDGHLLLSLPSVLSSSLRFTYRLSAEDARLSTPYRVRLSARTGRR